MIKVFPADDRELVRRGLFGLLAADPEMTVVGEAGTVSHALARIPVPRTDVAVVDVSLPDGNGIELCRELLSRSDEPRCLVLTAHTQGFTAGGDRPCGHVNGPNVGDPVPRVRCADRDGPTVNRPRSAGAGRTCLPTMSRGHRRKSRSANRRGARVCRSCAG